MSKPPSTPPDKINDARLREISNEAKKHFEGTGIIDKYWPITQRGEVLVPREQSANDFETLREWGNRWPNCKFLTVSHGNYTICSPISDDLKFDKSHGNPVPEENIVWFEDQPPISAEPEEKPELLRVDKELVAKILRDENLEDEWASEPEEEKPEVHLEVFKRGKLEISKRPVIAKSDEPEKKGCKGGDMEELVEKERDWFIPGLIPTGLTLVTGVTGLGKSRLASELIKANSFRTKFVGFDFEPGLLVGFIYEEPELFWSQIKRSGVRENTIHIFDNELKKLYEDNGNLIFSVIRQEEEFPISGPVRAILIDNLTQLCGDVGLAKAERFLNEVNALGKKYGVAVIILAHATEKVRLGTSLKVNIFGSTRPARAADGILALAPNGIGKIKLYYATRTTPVSQMELVSTEEGSWSFDEGFGKIEDLTFREISILRLLRKNDGVKLGLILSEFNLQKLTAIRILKKLIERGLVEKNGLSYNFAKEEK